MNEILNNPNEKVLTAFDLAKKNAQIYMGTLERPHIFNNFEKAAYFYRENAITTARDAVRIAIECNDEISAVKAYKNLFDLLAFDMDVAGKKKLFAECYEPTVNILTSNSAKGLQYYQLGHCARNLDIPSADMFFEKAVELNNENVLVEEIFTGNPQLVMHWLERYILDAEKNKQADEYEQLLNNLVKDNDKASDYYFNLAELLKLQFKDRADRYFRLCIKAGYGAEIGIAGCTEANGNLRERFLPVPVNEGFKARETPVSGQTLFLKPAPGAVAISEYYSDANNAPLNLPGHAAVMFETKNGRRRVVFGTHAFTAGLSKASGDRVMQLHRLCDWASHGKSPVLLETPTMSFVQPRVRKDGTLASVMFVNTSIGRSRPVRMRLRGVPASATKAVWSALDAEDVLLEIVRDGNDAVVTLPSVPAWTGGYVFFK